MDQVIHDANAEILNLRSKHAALQADMDSLKSKHQELTVSYGEKVRACVRAQKAHDELKKQMLQLDVQNAAADAADQALESSQRSRHPQSGMRTSRPMGHFSFQPAPRREQGHGHGSNSSGSGGQHEHDRFQGSQRPPYAQSASLATSATTAQHRQRLPFTQSMEGVGSNYRQPYVEAQYPPPSRAQYAPQRQPLQSLHPNMAANTPRHRMDDPTYSRKPNNSYLNPHRPYF